MEGRWRRRGEKWQGGWRGVGGDVAGMRRGGGNVAECGGDVAGVWQVWRGGGGDVLERWRDVAGSGGDVARSGRGAPS